MTKATAIAHPIQGLIKYHGLRDEKLRLPFHDSISVCTAPLETRTTVELQPDLEADVIEIDGKVVSGREYERAEIILNAIRHHTKRQERVMMRSANNFPSNIGLGASSSGFAALTMAANAIFEAGLTMRQMSAVARLGAGSASRSLAGSYAHWYAGVDHETSYAEAIASANQLPMAITIAVIPAFKITEDAHKEAVKSPFWACRAAYAKVILDDLRAAVIRGDFTTVGLLAEQDSLSLHATTMTGPAGMLHWQPETLMVFHEVRKMRQEGLEAYFSVDTGATVYINSRPQDREAVEARIQALGIETMASEVGGPARLVNEHLF